MSCYSKNYKVWERERGWRVKLDAEGEMNRSKPSREWKKDAKGIAHRPNFITSENLKETKVAMSEAGGDSALTGSNSGWKGELVYVGRS